MDNKEGKMKKKPRFKRQNFLLKKLKNVWRKPRGIHSKLRLKKRGKGRRPKIGYGNKKNIRGLIKDQEYTYVSSMKDIDNAEKILLISSNIGARKKMQIIEKAMNLGLKVININAEKFLEDMKNKKEERKKAEEKSRDEKAGMKKAKKEESQKEKEERLKGEKKKVLEKGM